MKGLASRGTKKAPPRRTKFTSLPTAINPAPSKPPTRPWVVEMGRARRVASITAAAAPRPTAMRKSAVPAVPAGTSPLPEKLATRPWARKMAHTAPAKVARVARAMAPR